MKKFLIIAVTALALTACSGSGKDSAATDSTTSQSTENLAKDSEEKRGPKLLEKVVGARYEKEAKSGTLYGFNFGPDNQMLIIYGLSDVKGIQVQYTPDFSASNGSIEIKDITVQETDGISKEEASAFVNTPMNIKFSNDFKTMEVSKCKDEHMNGTYNLANPEDFPEGF